MKKFILIIIFSIILILAGFISILATKGFETNRFNSLISSEIQKFEQNLKIDFQTLKIKIDFKKFNLFLSTNKPKAFYYNVNIPIRELKVYVDFKSIIKTKPKASRIVIAFNKFKIEEIKKIISTIKPSNTKRFILNNVANGEIKSTLDVYFNEKLEINNYKINGQVEKIDINASKKISFKKTNFSFLLDKDLILINSLNSTYKDVPITNGNIKINRKNSLDIQGSIITKINADTKKIKNIFSNKIKSVFLENQIKIQGSLTTEFKILFSKNLELKDYNLNIKGKLKEVNIKLKKPIKNQFLINNISELSFDRSEVEFNYNKNKNNQIDIYGYYKINDSKYEKYKLQNIFTKKKSNFNIDFIFSDKIIFDIINYKKQNNISANISSNFLLENGLINIKKINYIQDKNYLYLNDIKLNKKKEIESIKNIKIKTFIKDKINNDFSIIFSKKIIVKGKYLDATNLSKKINNKNKNSFLNTLSKDLQVSFDKIETKLSIPINNFNLIGSIKKGKFVKISSKSEFSRNKYLDISLKNSINSGDRVLEIYSDMPKAILADYNFFNGINEGKLLYVLKYNDEKSSSNLRIDNFKVKNAPAFAKLLSLADFRGAADLLSGEGISFETLEIKLSQNNDILNIDELYAVGPSISILMDGYVDYNTGLTSLRGSMVPARELNRLISKIPILGDILIGKEIGEGVFGVSFKIKGKSKKLKTTVNPLKTITPRFITRALEKRKKKN
jgi:hypothetical protein